MLVSLSQTLPTAANFVYVHHWHSDCGVRFFWGQSRPLLSYYRWQHFHAPDGRADHPYLHEM